ncbi:MAG: YesN/AraC family two-component response regulator, partial [Saprospiraceae bacterium]
MRPPQRTLLTVGIPFYINRKKYKSNIKEAVAKDMELPLLLIIEAHSEMASYLKKLVKNKYRLVNATSGQTGITKALELCPDIILCDVVIPGKNGIEVCRTLKTDTRTNHIPIVLVSSKVDILSRLEIFEIGADVYLFKPIPKEELLIRMKNLVGVRRIMKRKYSSKNSYNITIPQQDERNSTEGSFANTATKFIRDNLNEAAFGNAQLAIKMSLSESQLNRKIKKLTGKTLSIFIRYVRLQQAKKLLLSTDHNISEIAYSVGFNDPAYFSRTFSKEFNLSPS